MIVACKWKEIWKASGMTQEKLAKKLGIPKRTLEDWIAERRTPPEYVKNMVGEILLTDKTETIEIKKGLGKNDITTTWETKKGEKIEWSRIEEIEEELDEIEEWIDIILNFEPERNIKIRIDQIPKNIAKIRELLEI